MERTLRGSALVALLAGLAASCAASPGGSSGLLDLGDKAGGPATPIVLTLGTNDVPGDASGAYIEQFAADLARISGGLVTIEPRYRAAGEDVVRYDQRVAEMVRRGELDLGVVPARAFDELGVTSLQALQAPFLLTDDDAMDAVVAGTMRDDLLSGLPGGWLRGSGTVAGRAPPPVQLRRTDPEAGRLPRPVAAVAVRAPVLGPDGGPRRAPAGPE